MTRFKINVIDSNNTAIYLIDTNILQEETMTTLNAIHKTMVTILTINSYNIIIACNQKKNENNIALYYSKQ